MLARRGVRTVGIGWGRLRVVGGCRFALQHGTMSTHLAVAISIHGLLLG